MAAIFTFGIVLQIIFKHLNESPSMLAEFYIDRDRTLVYKWLHDTATPSKKLIPDIIRFVKESSGEPTRVQIKADLDKHILGSTLSEELQGVLTSDADFERYLESIMNIAIAESKSSKTTYTAPSEQQAPVKKPFAAVFILNIVFAILAAITGGVLWNLINHALAWPYYMGGPGHEPFGLAAFVWGVVSISPVIIFAMLSLRREVPAIKCFKEINKVGLICFYALAGGIGALLFYNSGFRSFVEQLNVGYALEEIIIVFVYSLILSFLPALAVLLLMRLPGMKPAIFFGLEFFSAAMCMLAVALTALVNRPEAEVAPLRSFLVGFILRLTMFISIRIILKGYPDQIVFPRRK